MNLVEKTRVTNFQEYNEIIGKFGGDNFLFRGVNKLEHQLIPKIGRNHSNALENEYDIISEFRKLAYPYLKNNINFENDLEVLTIAQHHGLPTRLLDWSKNPLVGTYFSIYSIEDCDSVLYVLNSDTLPSSKDSLQDEGGAILGADIVSSSEIFIYDPSHITERIVAQSGLFTYHNDPSIDMMAYIEENNRILKEIEDCIEEKGVKLAKKEFQEKGIDIHRYQSEKREIFVHQIIIDKNFKNSLLTILNQYGINHSGLFPGLDGISTHLYWKYTQTQF